MLKIRIEQKGKLVQNIIKPAEKFVINIDIPVSIQHVNAAYYDKANAKEGKTMEDLCRDVAEILKNEYSFKILKKIRKGLILMEIGL